ncbi:hypothetical protein CDL12_14730 [Handroanthus impetiginosus]|uniref:Uncharacterized protein n=1 Tax=Handroanthus impetiginosus TaxID=429701 RepID=A0A2G9H565_9LAMI|nr:hypothetical protein CDL12_14730 [Handroanthus impetiginosus]
MTDSHLPWRAVALVEPIKLAAVMGSPSPSLCLSPFRMEEALRSTLSVSISPFLGLFEVVENSFGPFLCRGRRKSKSHSKKFT